MTYYIHSVPGRLRITSPVVKYDGAAATEMVHLLQEMIGVERVAIRVTTGSCLIHYDPAIMHPDALVRALSRKGYFDPSQAITNDECVRNVTAKLFSFLAAFV